MVRKAAHATPNGQLRAARKERGWTQRQVADRIGAPLSLNVSRWENGMAFPSAYYIERLCQLFGKSVRELGLSQLEGEKREEQASLQATPLEQVPGPGSSSETEPEPVSSTWADQQGRFHLNGATQAWMLPYQRNPFFLGREEVLTRLRYQLQAGQTMALCQPQAISGLGGVGKTQVALEYAYRHAEDYQAVFWIRADSHSALAAGYFQIAQSLKLLQRDERDQTVMIAAVKDWFRQHTGWLLILDNADDLSLLPEFLPAQMGGHLLLTTRAQALGHLANRIEVEALDHDAAALLLLRRAGLLALDAPLAWARQSDLQAAKLLDRELCGLPLALDQAGAYLEETGCSLQQYLGLYRSHRADLLRHRGGVVPDHPDSVATTWSLSFASIEERNIVAVDILRVCALLHPDAIPEELFLGGAAHLGPGLAAIETDLLGFNSALSAIQHYSLLRRSSQEQMLSIHRVVQAVLADGMSEHEHDLWTGRAVAALNALFPAVRSQGWEQWSQCNRLLPHVLIVVEATQQHNLELVSLLTKTADYLLQRAQYKQAEPLYQRALALCEQMSDNGHLQLAFALNGLADLYREQGRYEQAEPLYQRALCLWEEAPYTQQAEVPSPLNNLALLYQEQGRYEQAEQLLLRKLSYYEQRFGLEHYEIATPLNNLAILYMEQGRHGQAEPLLQRALLLDEQAFGKAHPEVAYSLNNLACLYLEQGRYEQAEPLLERALHIREQTLGPEHFQVSFPLTDLGDLYREQGRYAEAEPLYRRALHILEQTLGYEHLKVAYPLNGLATVYREQGHYEQAEACYQRALTIRQQLREARQLETAETLHEFARLYELLDQPEEALAFYLQALAIREQHLGETHPSTLASRERCARLLRASRQPEEDARAEERSMEAGESMTVRRPAARLLPSAKSPLTYPNGLTAREVDVLRLVAQGLSDARIAERLGISPRTVNNHLTSIYGKIQVSSRAAATRYAFERQLVCVSRSSDEIPSPE